MPKFFILYRPDADGNVDVDRDLDKTRMILETVFDLPAGSVKNRPTSATTAGSFYRRFQEDYSMARIIKCMASIFSLRNDWWISNQPPSRSPPLAVTNSGNQAGFNDMIQTILMGMHERNTEMKDAIKNFHQFLALPLLSVSCRFYGTCCRATANSLASLLCPCCRRMV